MNDVERLKEDGISRPHDKAPHAQGILSSAVPSKHLLKQPNPLNSPIVSGEPAPFTHVTTSDPIRQVTDAPPGDLVALGVNLAAERLAEGKRVVLLAESPKRRDAFIDALQRVGLRDLAVQIDERSSHFALLHELRSTLALEPLPTPPRINHQEQRDKLSDRLALHSKLLGTEIQHKGVTPYEALGATLAKQKRDGLSQSFDFSTLKLHEWDRERIANAIELARSVDELFLNGVPPGKNPWRGSRLSGDLPADAASLAKEALRAASILSTETEALCKSLGLPLHMSEEQLEKALSALSVIDSLESKAGEAFRQVSLRSLRTWSDNREHIESALQRMLDYARCFRDLGDKIDFFSLKSLRIRDALQLAMNYQKKNFLGRSFDSEYRRMLSQVASVCPVPERVEDVIKTLGYLSRLQTIQNQAEQGSEALDGLFSDAPLFGATETPVDLLTEWRQRSQIAAAVLTVAEAVEALGDRTMVSLLKKPHGVYEQSGKLHEVRSLLKTYQEARKALFDSIDLDPEEQFSAFTQQPVAVQLKRLSALAVDTGCWSSWQQCIEISSKAGTYNFPFIADYAMSDAPAANGLTPELVHAWHSSIANDFVTSRPSMTALDANKSALVERMLTADRAMRDTFAAHVARRHWEEIPRFACGGEASVLHEIVQDPSLCDSPLDVVNGIPRALQATKPLIVCAPSLLDHLPAGFDADTVIVDKGTTLSAGTPLSSNQKNSELLQLSDELPSIPSSLLPVSTEAATAELTDRIPLRNSREPVKPPRIDLFAAHLRQILEKDLGLSVHINVATPHGVVDLAVVDSLNQKHFMLCIFLDGPRYQTAPSILDEERTRESAAHELSGRAPHREWILDWHSDPTLQKRQFISAVKRALATEANQGEAASTRNIARHPLSAEHTGLFAPYTTTVLDGGTARVLQRNRGEVEPLIMADVITSIVQQEGPIHRDELIARFAQLSGLRQIGDSHLLSIIEGVQRALRNRHIIMRDDCAFSSEKDQTVYPRVRGNLPGTLSRFERIPPDELQAGICALVKKAHGISQEELPKQLFAAFGYKVTPFAGDKLLQQNMTYLLEKGVLVEKDGRVFLRK